MRKRAWRKRHARKRRGGPPGPNRGRGAVPRRALPPVEVSAKPPPVPAFGPSPAMDEAARLRRALGSMAPGTLDRQLGIGRGTTRRALLGGLPLDKAGGGKVLAWVEAYEARAGG